MYRFVLLSVGFNFNLIRCICMKLLGPLVSQAVIVCVTLCWCWVSGRRLLWACMCLCDCLCSCPQTFIYTPFSPFNFTWLPFLFWKSSGKSYVFFFNLSVWMCHFLTNTDTRTCSPSLILKDHKEFLLFWKESPPSLCWYQSNLLFPLEHWFSHEFNLY